MSMTSCLWRLLAALPVSLASLGAFAADPQLSVEGGLSYMGRYYTVKQSAPVIFIEVVFDEHRIGRSRFSWSPDVMGGWMDGRDFDRYDTKTFTTRDHIWLVAAGVRLHYGDADAWYRPLFFSFQPTLHTGRTPGLSSAYEFTETLGWQARHWMVGVRHISNGFLHQPNLGETMFIVGVTF